MDEHKDTKVRGRFASLKWAVKWGLFAYLFLTAFIYLGLYFAGASLDRPAVYAELNQNITDKIPIVYGDTYPMAFYGLEEHHPFDTRKGAHIFDALVHASPLERDTAITAGKPSNEILELAHDASYLDSLRNSATLARITELEFLRLLPTRLTRNIILEPMLYQAGGSLQAALAALEHGWSINLGGGFHHASRDRGEGFCAIADVSMIVKYLRREGKIKKAMIVDLDAHQGNGHGRDFTGDEDVFIIDAYNGRIYPRDEPAKRGIDLAIELPPWTTDEAYLPAVKNALEKAFTDFKPDIVIYIAGADILTGDPLGSLGISNRGLIKRDELVFGAALSRRVPVVMLLGGGYQKDNAPVIAQSIEHLREKFDLF